MLYEKTAGFAARLLVLFHDVMKRKKTLTMEENGKSKQRPSNAKQ